jgi:hypothetical protein
MDVDELQHALGAIVLEVSCFTWRRSAIRNPRCRLGPHDPMLFATNSGSHVTKQLRACGFGHQCLSMRYLATAARFIRPGRC